MFTFNQAEATSYANFHIRSELLSRFAQANPLFFMLSGKTPGINADYLFRQRKNPAENWSKGISMGGGLTPLAQRAGRINSPTVFLRYQTAEPDGVTNVGPGEATGTATVDADDLIGMAPVKWRKIAQFPLEVKQDTIDDAKSSTGVSDPLVEAAAMSANVVVNTQQSEFWTGTLTQAQQQAQRWHTKLGIRHWVDDGVTYQYVCGLDRTLSGNESLKANVYTAAGLVTAGDMSSTTPDLSLIRTLKIKDSAGGTSLKAVCNKDARAGDLCIVDPAVFLVFAQAVDGAQTRWLDAGEKVPGIGHTYGFQYPVIMYDNTLVTYDPSCPSGELYLLTSGTWHYEIAPGYNYAVTKWNNDWEVTRGGVMKRWANTLLRDRLYPNRIDLNTKVTGLTAA
jgi:hypothetical protein